MTMAAFPTNPNPPLSLSPADMIAALKSQMTAAGLGSPADPTSGQQMPNVNPAPFTVTPSGTSVAPGGAPAQPAATDWAAKRAQLAQLMGNNSMDWVNDPNASSMATLTGTPAATTGNAGQSIPQGGVAAVTVPTPQPTPGRVPGQPDPNAATQTPQQTIMPGSGGPPTSAGSYVAQYRATTPLPQRSPDALDGQNFNFSRLPAETPLPNAPQRDIQGEAKRTALGSVIATILARSAGNPLATDSSVGNFVQGADQGNDKAAQVAQTNFQNTATNVENQNQVARQNAEDQNALAAGGYQRGVATNAFNEKKFESDMAEYNKGLGISQQADVLNARMSHWTAQDGARATALLTQMDPTKAASIITDPNWLKANGYTEADIPSLQAIAGSNIRAGTMHDRTTEIGTNDTDTQRAKIIAQVAAATPASQPAMWKTYQQSGELDRLKIPYTTDANGNVSVTDTPLQTQAGATGATNADTNSTYKKGELALGQKSESDMAAYHAGMLKDSDSRVSMALSKINSTASDPTMKNAQKAFTINNRINALMTERANLQSPNLQAQIAESMDPTKTAARGDRINRLTTLIQQGRQIQAQFSPPKSTTIAPHQLATPGTAAAVPPPAGSGLSIGTPIPGIGGAPLVSGATNLNTLGGFTAFGTSPTPAPATVHHSQTQPRTTTGQFDAPTGGGGNSGSPKGLTAAQAATRAKIIAHLKAVQ